MKRSIKDIVRLNIRNLRPYTSARDDFYGGAEIWLDANENPYDPLPEDVKESKGNPRIAQLNRYPDPYQRILKEKIARVKSLRPEQIFLGNGSDEILDLLFRTFCEPGKDEVVIMPPTYGMYRVLADIHPAKIREIPLDPAFQPDVQAIRQQTGRSTKIIFICSPNNPTGNAVDPERLKDIMAFFDGLVVVDEAYIDFSPGKSILPLLSAYENLIILQTFSKARGLAGIRLGMAFAHPEVLSWLNRVKLPYNVNRLSITKAAEAVESDNAFDAVGAILREKKEMFVFLEDLPSVQQVYPSDANFILVCVRNPEKLYTFLIEKGIVVRLRSGIPGCGKAIRITIGTHEEMQRLKEIWREFDQKMI
ncbi:MAG: histidinol-phosphate transaminase [Chlorobi bacterium]|nr:histidinol-phosphate transaminase [Chlorobiota bacterium]